MVLRRLRHALTAVDTSSVAFWSFNHRCHSVLNILNTPSSNAESNVLYPFEAFSAERDRAGGGAGEGEEVGAGYLLPASQGSKEDDDRSRRSGQVKAGIQTENLKVWEGEFFELTRHRGMREPVTEAASYTLKTKTENTKEKTIVA